MQLDQLTGSSSSLVIICVEESGDRLLQHSQIRRLAQEHLDTGTSCFLQHAISKISGQKNDRYLEAARPECLCELNPVHCGKMKV